MATKRFKELKNLSKDELATKLRESEAELFQTKMKRVTGQLGDTALIWRLRKDVARIKTLQTANAMALAPGVIAKAAQVAVVTKATEKKAATKKTAKAATK